MHQKLPVFVASALAVTLTVTTSGSSPDTDRKIVHVLNRIAFGPRPGDLERVERLGVDRYIDQQLHPERIDDATMRAKVAGLRTLSLSSRQIADEYERPMLMARRDRAAAAASSSDAVTPPQPREQAAANLPLIELSQQKLLRAVFSERQLQEVLTDFWFNHFNVDARKGPERYLLTAYEREAIRPFVLGRFRDLLGATAKSPAMLFYLDNWMSADPNGPHLPDRAGRPRVARGPFGGRALMPPLAPMAQDKPAAKAPKGLNENY